MSSNDFDKWYETNPTSCDPKRSHLEGRVFALEEVLKEIGDRNPTGRQGYRSFVDELKDNIEKELEKYRKGLR